MYNVVAIGNALVDTEFTVSDSALAATGLTRGNMTLADTDTQAALFDTLHTHGIHPAKQAGGGSAANSMAAFAALGGSAFYNCRVGDDKMGEFYLQDLAEMGVATDTALATHQGGVTGSCAVLVTPDAERTMQTHLGASSEIDEKNVNFDALVAQNSAQNAKQKQWLYLEGYLAMSPSAMQAIAKLKAHAKECGTNIMVSFADPAVVKFAKAGLDEMLAGGVAAVFCNQEEALLYTETTDKQAAAHALLAHSELAVITDGENPTLIATRTAGTPELQYVATPKAVSVVDTNGAGDNFAGAFLYALSQGHALDECGKLAGAVASRVVAQFGARLTKAEYQEIKAGVL
ncbi:adenosine kinase [Moraxella caviae]|uniref:Adenosine kinase n=1 Tax=Moraxella caviae TaxID=34060 RepID=A0A1T0A560_9GAMM|nr:adenosine kinase [Moraxella caviae]OOR90854.1 adenosine kinase [Moraxella caviae]STZ10689.1 Uncharacterized sugar kinase ydjH [Moraxella caviae]VEW10862.1 Uncharacterized sugar kinase ydjH [Moraxella caviae]